jgi:hypothetical protein
MKTLGGFGSLASFGIALTWSDTALLARLGQNLGKWVLGPQTGQLDACFKAHIDSE